MKAKVIVGFIFGVLALLALVCWIFPEDGIKIGNVTLEFPTLHEVLAVDHEEAADTANAVPTDPDELFAFQLKNMSTDDQRAFMEFCQSNPARFHMPDSDLTYFDALFEAMENAKAEPMRILHYGDSQIEADRISMGLRERFQTAFGGSGVGIVPAVQSVGTLTLIQGSPKLPHYFAYNMGDHLSNGRYGVIAQVAKLSGAATFNFRSSEMDGVPHSKTFSKVTMVCSGTGTASATAGGMTVEMRDASTTGGEVKFLTAALGSPVKKVSVSARGNMEVFGFMLDGNDGISVDNVPMRGCSGTVFTQISRKTLEPYFKHNKIGLIILQYGGNSVPYMKREKQMRGYKQSLIAQVNLFKEMSPDSKILFIGPADMSTNVKGKKQTYPQLEATIKILEEVCHETGIAFWNLYEAMGGYNSMLRWVDANLAGKDYVHFTREGAGKVSDMLFNTYLMYYRFYCKRLGKTPKNFDAPQPQNQQAAK